MGEAILIFSVFGLIFRFAMRILSINPQGKKVSSSGQRYEYRNRVVDGKWPGARLPSQLPRIDSEAAGS